MDTGLYLEASYRDCQELHRAHGRTYYLATRLLPRWKRPHVHALYVEAFSNALHPVFLVAAAISGVAFVLSWFLTEVPLRRTTEAAAVA